ncbi:unnamed protein product [Leuciscus chuanchicus]
MLRMERRRDGVQWEEQQTTADQNLTNAHHSGSLAANQARALSERLDVWRLRNRIRCQNDFTLEMSTDDKEHSVYRHLTSHYQPNFSPQAHTNLKATSKQELLHTASLHICSLNYSGPTADFSHSCLCSASTVSLQLERNINKGRGIYIRIGRATERSKTTIRIQLNPRGAGGKESGERQRSQLLRRKGSKELFHSGRGLNVKNLGSALRHEGLHIRELDLSHER